MDGDLVSRFAVLEKKVDAIYVSVEKTRKYFQVVMWITIITIVLPIIVLIFIIPSLISSLISVDSLL